MTNCGSCLLVKMSFSILIHSKLIRSSPVASLISQAFIKHHLGVCWCARHRTSRDSWVQRKDKRKHLARAQQNSTGDVLRGKQNAVGVSRRSDMPSQSSWRMGPLFWSLNKEGREGVLCKEQHVYRLGVFLVTRGGGGEELRANELASLSD